MYDANNFGLSDDYEYHEMCIDSADATDAFDANYTINNWPKIGLGKPLDNVVAIKVLQVIVPKTYYVFNSRNNMFRYYTYQSPSTWIDRGLITVPVGNHTVDELNIFFKSTLEAIVVTTVNPWTITNVPHQLKQAFQNSTGSGVSRYQMFAFKVASNTFEEMNNSGRTNSRIALGWDGGSGRGTTAPITGSGISGSRGTAADPYQNVWPYASTVFPRLTYAPNVYQLNGPKYLYLNSKTLGPSININLNGYGHIIPANTGATGPQICKIPVDNTDFGSNIIYTDPDPQKWFTCPLGKFPSKFDFYLTLGVDDPNIPLDLNGNSFIIKLGILLSKKELKRDFTSTTSNGRVTKMIKTK